MSRAVQAFLIAARSTPPGEVGIFDAAIVKPLRVYLINLNYDEEQENFFLDRLVLNPITKTCELEAQYVQHLIEFLQGVPK